MHILHMMNLKSRPQFTLASSIGFLGFVPFWACLSLISLIKTVLEEMRDLETRVLYGGQDCSYSLGLL